MLGHGLRMTRYPPTLSGSEFPWRSTPSGTTPKNGRVAVPGPVGVQPGSGEIIMLPVAVCHQVSTIGQRLPPMTSRCHIQASGLIGSPTVPSKRREDMSYFLGH